MPRLYKAPKAAQEAVRRGLRIRDAQPMSNKCCTSAGILTARRILRGYMFDRAELAKIYSFHRRHRAARRGRKFSRSSKSTQALLLWGGEPMYRYTQRILGKLDKR
jgi:hypothetical protein